MNGLPVAINARPSVQAIRSAGVASASEGGLESGKIMGRSVCRAISLTIASVKAPAAPDAPISMVGRTWRITSARPMALGRRRRGSPVLHLGGRAGIGCLIVVQPVAHIVGEQPVHVHAPKPPRRLLERQTLIDHHIANQVGDADAGDACAENDDALIPQQRSADAHRGNRGCQRDRARALQIVAERADLAAIFFEDAASVAGPKIFPLQQRVRKQLRGGLDIGVDEGVVAFSADPRMPVPRVHRIGEQAFPVGAHVQHHRNHARRIDPARRRIDRQFADGDFDSADAPIADAEDLLGVGGQDQVDIVGTGPRFPNASSIASA